MIFEHLPVLRIRFWRKPVTEVLCKKCVLPNTFPGISFNSDGICNHCEQAESLDEYNEKRDTLYQQIASTFDAHRDKGEYDCIVAFSGGKDSSFTLYHLVETLGLNPLAITIDNGFISEQAFKNCNQITEALGVDFQIFKPAPTFMQNLYRISTKGNIHSPSAIKRASAMCNSCINLINSYMLKTALHTNTPIIAGGYIGGQVPKDAAVLELDLKTKSAANSRTLKGYEKHFGRLSLRYFDHSKTNTLLEKVIVINPMLAIQISEDEIIETIAKLGWIKTKDTGLNSSNCKLNDLGILIHYKQHQFHPYAFELSEQIRHGLLTREQALKKVSIIPNKEALTEQISKIGLEENELP